MEQDFQLQNDLNTDFKAVTKAAELIESGQFEHDQIAVLPAGARQRAFAKDIKGHSFYYSDSKHKDCLTIETNQEGLYDMLPEGLFHSSSMGNAGLSELDMIADVQLRRAEEKDARKFFMPFEAELNHLRTILELYENRLDKRTTYDDLTRVFGAEWKEFDILDKEQSVIWMHLLPVIHQKRNDLDFLGQLLSVLFKIPVHAVLHAHHISQVSIQENLQFKLGTGVLGISTVIGSAFPSTEEQVLINVGPADTHKLVSFMPGTAYSYIIDLAVSYLLPVETEVRVILVPNEKNRIGALGVEMDNSFLGYTVYL